MGFSFKFRYTSGMEQNSGAGQAVARTLPATAHLIEDHLELYYLGMIPEGPGLDAFEEHLLACPSCVGRAEASDAYVDAIRAGIIAGHFKLI